LALSRDIDLHFLRGVSANHSPGICQRAPRPEHLIDSRGFCPIELGPGSAALVAGDWYAEPEPAVTITGPSAAHASEKAAFETEHLQRWFGA
jgi:hypothetical protein